MLIEPKHIIKNCLMWIPFHMTRCSVLGTWRSMIKYAKPHLKRYESLQPYTKILDDT